MYDGDGRGAMLREVKIMLSHHRKNGFAAASIAAVCATLGAATVFAASSPPSDLERMTVQSAADGCGYGVFRAPDGVCDAISDPNRNCQPGFHALQTPLHGTGFRCVQDGY